jgi:acyl-[acyl carrier protein]--UDP-N-acetylglucosamine O-acyltransferase
MPATIYGKSKIGKGTYIADSVIVGHPAKDEKQLLLENRMGEVSGAIIGKGCVLRAFGVVYSRCNRPDRTSLDGTRGHDRRGRKPRRLGGRY